MSKKAFTANHPVWKVVEDKLKARLKEAEAAYAKAWKAEIERIGNNDPVWTKLESEFAEIRGVLDNSIKGDVLRSVVVVLDWQMDDIRQSWCRPSHDFAQTILAERRKAEALAQAWADRMVVWLSLAEASDMPAILKELGIEA